MLIFLSYVVYMVLTAGTRLKSRHFSLNSNQTSKGRWLPYGLAFEAAIFLVGFYFDKKKTFYNHGCDFKSPTYLKVTPNSVNVNFLKMNEWWS